MSTDFSSAIAALRTTMGNIVAVSNPDFLKSEIARLSEAELPPTFGMMLMRLRR